MNRLFLLFCYYKEVVSTTVHSGHNSVYGVCTSPRAGLQVIPLPISPTITMLFQKIPVYSLTSSEKSFHFPTYLTIIGVIIFFKNKNIYINNIFS